MARIVFALQSLWVLLSRDLPAFSALPAEFWLHVDRGDLLRYLIFVGNPGVEYALQGLAFVTLAGAALGIFPRVCCFLSAALLYHLAPLETIYWTANPYQRGFEVSILALFTLSFSRCGDALAWGARPEAASPDYCWPLRMLQIYVAHIYFVSGYSKLYRAGFSWLDPDNLRRWFLLFSQQDQVRRADALFNTVGPWIADHWVLCLLAAAYGVLANLLFVTAVVSRRARLFFVPDAVFFHVMVFLSLNIFWLNLPQLLVFVNWRWLADRLIARPPGFGANADVRA